MTRYIGKLYTKIPVYLLFLGIIWLPLSEGDSVADYLDRIHRAKTESFTDALKNELRPEDLHFRSDYIEWIDQGAGVQIVNLLNDLTSIDYLPPETWCRVLVEKAKWESGTVKMSSARETLATLRQELSPESHDKMLVELAFAKLLSNIVTASAHTEDKDIAELIQTYDDLLANYAVSLDTIQARLDFANTLFFEASLNHNDDYIQRASQQIERAKVDAASVRQLELVDAEAAHLERIESTIAMLSNTVSAIQKGQTARDIDIRSNNDSLVSNVITLPDETGSIAKNTVGTASENSTATVSEASEERTRTEKVISKYQIWTAVVVAFVCLAIAILYVRKLKSNR